MNFHSLSDSKKGLYVGILIGLFLESLPLLFNCHSSLGGVVGVCNNFLETSFAMIEFFVTLPVLILTSFNNPLSLLFYDDLRWYYLFCFVCFGLFFGLIGFTIGFIKERRLKN